MNSRTLAFAALSICSTNLLSLAESLPNVLVILADDLGYADLGVQGCKDIPTPHIDSIAKNGIRCTSGYVSSCMCSPSRAGLMTGRSQSRFGHEINWEGNGPSGEKGLPLSEKTFATLMKLGGFRTGVVGKWHLGNEDRFHPLARGFDEFFGFLGGGHDYLSDWREDNLLQRNREQRGSTGKKPDESRYLTTVLGQEAAEYIHRNRETPWLLYLAFNAPHTPHQATKELLARFASIEDENRRVYAAMVSGLDDAVGTVLKQLKKDGLDDNTIIAFLSDNGGPLERNGSLNTPLSGEKGSMFEGGIRVPFFIQWKSRLGAGKTYDRPVSSLDLLPTALAAAKIEPPKEIEFDGVNLLPFLTGELPGDPHVALYWRMKPRDIWAVRAGDDKLIMQHRGGPKHPVGKSPRLIQLGTDLQELNDLSSVNPRRASELRSMYDAWNSTLIEPLWGIEKGEKE
jgi:arylsulfatase A-like enzyme